jgi:hypothetical protein
MRKKTIIYKIIGSSAKCLVFIGKKLVSTICLLTGTAQFTIYGVLLKYTDFYNIRTQAKNIATDYNYHSSI